MRSLLTLIKYRKALTQMTDNAEYFWLNQQGKFVKSFQVADHYHDMIVACKKQEILFYRYLLVSPYWAAIDITEMDCAEVKELKAHLLLEGINL